MTIVRVGGCWRNEAKEDAPMSELELVAKWRAEAQVDVEGGCMSHAFVSERHADELEALLNAQSKGPYRVSPWGEQTTRPLIGRLTAYAAALRKHGDERTMEAALVEEAIHALALRGLAAPSPGGVDDAQRLRRLTQRMVEVVGADGPCNAEDALDRLLALRPTPPEVTDGIGYDIDHEGIVSLWRQNADGTRNLLVLTPQASADFTAALAGGK